MTQKEKEIRAEGFTDGYEKGETDTARRIAELLAKEYGLHIEL